SDLAQWLKMVGKLGASHRRAHPPAVLRQRLHRVAAKKARAAEDDDLASLFPTRSHILYPSRFLRCLVAYRLMPDGTLTTVNFAFAVYKDKGPGDRDRGIPTEHSCAFLGKLTFVRARAGAIA